MTTEEAMYIISTNKKPDTMGEMEWWTYLFGRSDTDRKRLRKKLPKDILEGLEVWYKQRQEQKDKNYWDGVFGRKKKKYKANKTYKSYMSSKKWADKRKEKLSTQSCCEMCGSKDNLHIHHNSYDNFKNEKMEDLTVLCAKCHLEIHS